MKDEDYSKYVRFDHAAANVGIVPAVQPTRQQLESTLARTFVTWMRLTDPAKRQEAWLEMFRLGREIERLNDRG